jgi:hypothetical protein
MPDLEKIAADLYTLYCRAVGGVAFNGDPLPSWAEFSVDPAKQTQAEAWRDVAAAAAGWRRMSQPIREPIPITFEQLESLRASLPDPEFETYTRCLLKKPPSAPASYEVDPAAPADFPAWSLHFEHEFTPNGWRWKILNESFRLTI